MYGAKPGDSSYASNCLPGNLQKKCFLFIFIIVDGITMADWKNTWIPAVDLQTNLPGL